MDAFPRSRISMLSPLLLLSMLATEPEVASPPAQPTRPATPAAWKRGAILPSDYPPKALLAGAGGTVHLSFVVGPKGRLTECTVTKSSGRRDLDSTTCRLLMKRLRYRAARDSAGNPVPSTITGTHDWGI
jgi:protein TonB